MKERMYPDVNDPLFQYKITYKKEFAKFRSLQKELGDKAYEEISDDQCNPQQNFRLTANQLFVRNFLSPLTPYNGILLYHGVGVGKTCSAITIAEQFDFPNQTIVLTPVTLKDNFINQLHATCGRRLLHKLVGDFQNKPQEIINKEIKKHIDAKYKFHGYQEFSRRIEELRTTLSNKYADDETQFAEEYRREIQKRYSDRIFILDEAHNIRSDEDEHDKTTPIRILEVLTHARNTKLIMMTATPMYNDSREIIWFLNYLLTNDKLPLLNKNSVFDKNGFIKNKTALASASRGYVSFIQGLNPFAFPLVFFPFDSGIKGAPLSDKLYPSYFSDYHKSVYKKNYNLVQHKILVILQLSNIVFPCQNIDSLTEADYGKNAFIKCFHTKTIKGSTQFSYKESIPKFLNFDQIQTYSCKMYTILNKILNSEGTIFVYSHFLHSGILPLGIALEHLGFRRSLNKPSLLNENDKQDNVRGYYSILTQDNQFSINIDKEIQEINSGRIKVVLGTSVVSEGINFKNIREVHILEPWYHLNKIKQIVGRSVRRCSHISLPPSKRNVTVYLHSALERNNPSLYYIDLRQYKLCENKQNAISEVHKILIENSIDCILNSDHNFSKYNFVLQDITNSQGQHMSNVNVDQHLGFMENNLFHSSPCGYFDSSVKLDDSTYDDYFLFEEIDEVINQVKHYFYTNIKGTALDVSEFIHEDFEITNISLHYMVRKQIPVQYKNNILGQLIKKTGDVFLFHPKGVDLNIMLTDTQRMGLTPINTPVKSIYFPDVLDYNELNVMHENPVQEIYTKIELLQIALKNELLKMNYQAFIDFFVDRLNEKQLLSLINLIVHNYVKDPLIKNSIFSAKYLFYVQNNIMNNWIFKNPFKDNEFLIFENGEWKKASILDIEQVIKPSFQDITNSTQGYFNVRKGVFSIINKTNNQGTVCGSGSISSKNLYLRIFQLLGISFDFQKFTKKQMCSTFEIMLRILSFRGESIFVRKI